MQGQILALPGETIAAAEMQVCNSKMLLPCCPSMAAQKLHFGRPGWAVNATDHSLASLLLPVHHPRSKGAEARVSVMP